MVVELISLTKSDESLLIKVLNPLMHNLSKWSDTL